MYMALTEKDKVNIQKNGFYVIEFKKIVYKLLPYINEFVEYGKRMMKTFSDLADEIKYCYIHCYGCDMDFMPDSDIAKDVMEAWNRRVGEQNE